MKDEFKGIPINKFIRLKSKMHCTLSENYQEVNTAKVSNISIEFKECKNFLFNKKLIRHDIKRIQNKLNKSVTYNVSKIFLLRFEDKRYILNDGITTLAFCHKDLED